MKRILMRDENDFPLPLYKLYGTSWNPVSKSDLQSHKILHDGALYPFNPSLPTPAPLATSLQMDPLS